MNDGNGIYPQKWAALPDWPVTGGIPIHDNINPSSLPLFDYESA
jgi:hypothetical protein